MALYRYMFLAWMPLVLHGIAQVAAAAPGAADLIAADFEQHVTALDSNEFAARQQAISRLEQLAEDKHAGAKLAELVQQKLVTDSLSEEARAILEDYAERLPKIVLPPPGDIAGHELDRLLTQLDDGSSAARTGALRRITWLAQHPKVSLEVWRRLNERLSDTSQLPARSKRWDELRGQMRSAWLAADGDWRDLPQASEQQLGRWIESISSAREDNAREAIAAYKELENVLLRDDQVASVSGRLQAALHDEPTRIGIELMERLLQWTRPAMVAEIWSEHHQVNTQHLIVGVPQINFDNVPNTHFDRIDDETANCVSGVNLAPGVYPVGVANTKTRFASDSPRVVDNLRHVYHLVNLDTPRRRMAYPLRAKRDERMRLKEMSQRTVDWYLQRATPLKETEVITLPQLDHEVVSKFVGNYFAAIEDQNISDDESLTGQSSIHQAICLVLIRIGTPTAVPALEELGKKIELSEQTPANIAWLSALVIANRRPWPEADDWLANLALRTDPLLYNVEAEADLGATAAATLLKRHEQDPQDFGFQQAAISGPLGPRQFEQLGFKVYRATAAQRQAVISWWQNKKQEQGKETAG